MNTQDATYHTVHDYPGGASSLAPRMGMPVGVLNSKVNPNTHTHHLALSEAVRLMAITGDRPAMSATDIMVDIETLSTRPDAAILSIGVVAIDRNTGAEVSAQKWLLSVQPQIDQGAAVDEDTVRWWLRQSDAARSALDGDIRPFCAGTMAEFVGFVESWPDAPIWANPATFDLVILRQACSRAYVGVWDWRRERCYRTFRNLLPGAPRPPDLGVKHSALDDARWQALHLVELFRALEGRV